MSARAHKKIVRLTAVRAQILCCLANGETQKSTALQLGLSPSTIAYHLSRMQDRLEIPSSTALVALAIAAGILTTGQWPVSLTGALVIELDVGP